MARPGLSTIKTLFAHSCNRCAFPGCDLRLTDPSWDGVQADMAHIRGEKPGAARYAPDMTDAERNGIDNLMLLCPNHHREIDRLSPADWSAVRLMRAKMDHETSCTETNWASDSMLEHLGSLIASSMADPSSEANIAHPRLVVQKGPKDQFRVVNTSDADALQVSVSDSPDSPEGILRLEEGQLARLSPGAEWTAGLHVKTFGSAGQVIVRVEWTDEAGESYDADFPL